jgi:hypothetical protein
LSPIFTIDIKNSVSVFTVSISTEIFLEKKTEEKRWETTQSQEAV